jgi:hypothetical protein
MKLTKAIAKEDSLKKWEALSITPYKVTSPKHVKLMEKLNLNKYTADCALCELYFMKGTVTVCNKKCPLHKSGNYCIQYGSLYSMYANEKIMKKRKLIAAEIVKVIKEWKVR